LITFTQVAANRPASSSAAAFTVHQAHGVARQRITSFALWMSVDDGATWRAMPVSRAGADRFGGDRPGQCGPEGCGRQ